MKEKIKEIIANILYLDSIDDISDEAALFTELGLSSIDYIDLCFELKNHFEKDVTLDLLWPINRWLSENEYYYQNQWTDVGWRKVVDLLRFTPDTGKQPVQELYHFFNVIYIENRLQELV